MFDTMADEIFEQADVEKIGNEKIWRQVQEILATKMAQLSATMGLTVERLTFFEEQRKALIDDLVKMREAGEVERPAKNDTHN
jgi:hypothetical protein